MGKRLQLLTKFAGSMLRSSWPSYAVIFVTARCNARCVMCFNWENVWKPPKEPEITVEEFERLATSMRPMTQLLLSGGEPFLRDDLPGIIGAFYRNSGTELVTIPTNAYLPDAVEESTAKVLTDCPDLYMNINLSIDALGEKHDEVRGVKKQFPKILESYKRLNRLREKFSNLTINAVTVVSKFNIDEVKETIRHLRETMRLDYHNLVPVRGSTPEKDAREITLEDVEDVFAFSDSYRAKNSGKYMMSGLAEGIILNIRDAMLRSMESDKREFKCLAGRKMVVITHDAKVYPCEPLWLDDKKKKTFPRDALMGDLREADFDMRRILESDAAKQIVADVDKKTCHCMYGCAMYNGFLYGPSTYPSTLKRALLDPRKKRMAASAS